MNTVRNLAGNDVSIFLFQFELTGNGINFVLNEAIAADMYPDLDEKLKPLIHACCETLSRYRHLSVSNTIMDGNILSTGEFEVMLSKGLGRHFVEDEKQQLFQDAKHIADLLAAVMDRRTKEEREGKQQRKSRKSHSQNTKKTKKGLEELGQAKHLQAELQSMAEGKQIRPGLKQLRLEDFPSGVTASRGYDHRGQCYLFEHQTLGELGKIVLIKMSEEKTVLQAELYKGQEAIDSPLIQKKRKVFERIVATVDNCLNENFSE